MNRFWASKIGQSILWWQVRMTARFAYWNLRLHGASDDEAYDAVYLCLWREIGRDRLASARGTPVQEDSDVR